MMAEVASRAQQALADCREPFGVVVPLARVDRDLIASLVQLSAPAVELDLVQPLRPGRRLALQRDGMMKGSTVQIWVYGTVTSRSAPRLAKHQR